MHFQQQAFRSFVLVLFSLINSLLEGFHLTESYIEYPLGFVVLLRYHLQKHAVAIKVVINIFFDCQLIGWLMIS